VFVGTEEEARAELETMVSASSDPALSSDEVTSLLLKSKRADRFGVRPGDDGWEETWDLDSAAAKGWERKAGKAASRVDFSADGANIRGSQTYEACMKIAATYAAKIVTSAPTRLRARY